MRPLTVCIFLMIFIFVTCIGIVETRSQNVTKPTEPAKGSIAEPVAKAIPQTLTGTVLETLNAGRYIYLRLKTPDGETWAAVTKADVKKGSEVTILNPIPMDGFESKTLKRKFDHIVFGTLSATGASDPALAISHGSPAGVTPQNIAEMHRKIGNAPADVTKINVKKAEGKNGKTVAEIFSGKSSLKNTTVEVRGKVVKFNPMVMGKNWIHLRDGSGSREKKNDDITVTTQDSAAVGDVVLVKGTVRLDRDFGGVYKYSVIIEDAKLSK